MNGVSSGDPVGKYGDGLSGGGRNGVGGDGGGSEGEWGGGAPDGR